MAVNLQTEQGTPPSHFFLRDRHIVQAVVCPAGRPRPGRPLRDDDDDNDETDGVLAPGGARLDMLEADGPGCLEF
eukprot:2822346-Rhodomonas_salina.1